MSVNELFMITPSPVLSGLIWLVLAIATLYLARDTAHKAIHVVTHGLHNALRIGARGLNRAQGRLSERNREVLLAAGREAKERIIEREFDRVGDAVQKDLAGYPALSRDLDEAITRIDEDHQQAVEVPPDPPGWVKAVEAVAKIEDRGDPMVGNMLGEIHKSLLKAHKQALEQYRLVSHERHEHLRSMMPQWRSIKKTLGTVNKAVDSLLQRSRAIDRHMQDYEEIVKGTDRAVQLLSSSSLVQLFVSALVLTVAVGGAAINFTLIARPMAEMVGGTSFIAGFRTADIAALVIIMVEISMGLFLMESLRITRLFPVIGALPDKVRVRMIWITLFILTLLASVEAGLAYMRELLLQDELATSALLRGGDGGVLTGSHLWITTAAQMGMGFILPFALVFVAIPLETFVHSLRTALGVLGIALVRALALAMRVLGNLFHHTGLLLQRGYDLLIFMPLWMEERMERKARRSTDAESDSDNFGEVAS